MSRANIELVRGGYEMLERGQLEELAALFSFDADLADAGGLGIAGTAAGRRIGPAGFLQAVAEAREAFDDYTVEAEDFIDVGDSVVVVARISGRGQESGLEMEMQVAHLWTVRDGKVVLGEVYRTVDEALEAARRQE
jgi:ketosteroid isomerase-like protein